MTGDVYVAGISNSSTFPGTVGGAQENLAGSYKDRKYDFFVARLNSSLTTLIQSTYLGGNSYESGVTIAIDPVSGDVYVAGQTSSRDLPGTSGGAQAVLADGNDVYIARLNASLTTLIQATYLGGRQDELSAYIALHPVSGDVYVTGRTLSENFPGTSGGAQEMYAGGGDSFISSLNADLTTLIQSTFLGGNSADGGYYFSISFHPVTGEVYVTGYTESSNFPGVAGGLQPAYGAGAFAGDAYISRLNSGLTKLIQSTYLGGSHIELGAVGAFHPVSGELYVAGYTYASDFPGTAGGAQAVFGGVYADAFIARMTGSLALNDYTFTATQSGTGSGMVNATDGLITCGSDCSEIYGNFLVVTLSATPEAGSIFSGWSGACSNVVGDCVVTMDADKTATAIFNLPLALTVSKTGGGAGSVTSSDGGINCGADCSESYASNAQVTLTATAETGSTFAFWSGACSGSRATCTVTMDAAKSVTAKFNRIR